MAIKMIACINDLGYLGKDGDLLYKIKKDLQLFKEKTLHQIMIVGSGTWNSLPKKPLPSRINVVLSSRKLKLPNGVFLAHSKEQILNHYLESNRNEFDKDIWICGGQSLYIDFMKHTDEIYLTRVKDDKVGDVSFPMNKMEKFFSLVGEELEEHEEDGVEFTFEKWIRKDIKDLS